MNNRLIFTSSAYPKKELSNSDSLLKKGIKTIEDLEIEGV